MVTAAHGHSQLQRSHQRNAGLLGGNWISNEVGLGRWRAERDEPATGTLTRWTKRNSANPYIAFFGNFDVKDEPRSGTDKVDAIFEKLEQDRHISSYDVAEELEIIYKTVLTHLKKVGYTEMLDTGVPHDLTERNLMNRVLICDSLVKYNETEPLFETGKTINSDFS
ncbi:Histone-lysine N-methyltransferase SETMAR [Eumeta japonica]|uniref:Histone-lysine N-methyltransferase SETMAR n=1 Tax=Eumeta variegata TaxID=151549 RepID=A0A4C1UHM5_EUMVA|nr:Histone-lysine N-methyltransferase SETMAR [Eumeta japonica]